MRPCCYFSLFWAIKEQLPLECPSSLSSTNLSIQKPEVQSNGSLKSKAHKSCPNHPPKQHEKIEKPGKGRGGSEGCGGSDIYSNISTSATDPTEERMFFIFNITSLREKKTRFLRDFLDKDFTWGPRTLFCLNKDSEFLISIYHRPNSADFLKSLYTSRVGNL